MFREKERTKKERERRQPRIKKNGNRVRRRIVKMDGGNNKVKTCVYEDRSLESRKVKLQKRERKDMVMDWATYMVPPGMSLRIAPSHNSVTWFYKSRYEINNYEKRAFIFNYCNRPNDFLHFLMRQYKILRGTERCL